MRRLALALTGTDTDTDEESSYGSPSWKVRFETFGWDRPLCKTDRAALGAAAPDGPVVAVRVPDEAARQAVLADAPTWAFTVPHVEGYPAVLVRLDLVLLDELQELVVEARLALASAKLIRDGQG